MDDIARDGHIEGIGGVGQGRDVGLLDGDVRVYRELLARLLEHALGVVGRDHTRACGGDGGANRARSARTFEHGVTGANQPGNGTARPVVHPPVERVDDEVVERGNSIPEQC